MKKTGTLVSGNDGELILQTRNAWRRPDDYSEEPRASLYNVIKQLRENSGGYKRLLYITELSPPLVKSEGIENVVANHLKQCCDDPEEFEDRVNGCCIILDKWVLHYVEVIELEMIHKILKHLKVEIENNAKGTIYQRGYIIHFTEEAPEAAYTEWRCQAINTSQSQRSIVTLPIEEKVFTLYDDMTKIGAELTKASAQGKQVAVLKSKVNELIPANEELASVICEDISTIGNFCDYIQFPPDILLEKELCWPVEAELTY
mmetsp:Transcript_63893/g.88234  ORF Transcript_63893/g.88234 Transcript_63893/m.88234 type:complete len:260 (-) Transcript_63893:52-831(-)